jgi:predicted peroxiredoxin
MGGNVVRRLLIGALFLSLTICTGCANPENNEESSARETEPQIMFFNITSGPNEDPHAVTMALQLAGHALDDGRTVVFFFNVRGVRIPLQNLADDLAFREKPIKQLLQDLLKRGAQAHVCPHCLAALDIGADSLIPEAFVTDRDKLFGTLGENTVVFTY